MCLSDEMKILVCSFLSVSRDACRVSWRMCIKASAYRWIFGLGISGLITCWVRHESLMLDANASKQAQKGACEVVKSPMVLLDNSLALFRKLKAERTTVD